MRGTHDMSHSNIFVSPKFLKSVWFLEKHFLIKNICLYLVVAFTKKALDENMPI